MDSKRFQKLSQIFDAARQLAANERPPFLDKSCGGDSALRAEVEELLRADAEPEGVLGDSDLERGEDLRAAFLRSGDTPPEDDTPNAEIPERVGRYEIVEEIARGGIGIVFRGRDDRLRRDIAVKTILDSHGADESIVQRLVEEAQVAGQLEHPGIVPVHELGLMGTDHPYLTMKLVKGRTLAELLSERTDRAKERQRFLGIFEQVCQAIAYAHSRGVIHRDLKPANLMVGEFGEVQVMDWGLAKVLASSPVSAEDFPEAPSPQRKIDTVRNDIESRQSLSGTVMGTPAYMSPEQARGEVEALDKRTDVFSLGAILCEILTGNPPFLGMTTGEVIHKARSGSVGPAAERLAECGAGPELIALATRSLAARSEARPVDARALAKEIRDYLESLEERATHAILEAAESKVRAEGERRARRLTTLLGGVVTVAILAGSLSFWWVESARQDRIRGAELALDRSTRDAEQLAVEAAAAGIRGLDRWEAALVAARGAVALVTDGVSDEKKERAGRLVSDLESDVSGARLVNALEQVRLEYDHVESILMATEDPERERAFARTFLESLGLDVMAVDEELAVGAIKRFGFSEEIAKAMDEWAGAKRSLEGADSVAWKRLLCIAARIDPDMARVRLREAIKSGEREPLQALADSGELAAASPLTLNLLARSLHSAGDPARARQIWLLAREQHPDDFWVNVNLGRVLSVDEPKRLNDAVACYAAALALRPESVLTYEMLARCHRHLGDLEIALGYLKRALSLKPRSALLQLTLGVTLQDRGDLDKAEAAYREGLALEPEDRRLRGMLLTNLAGVLFRKGEMDGMLPLLEQALVQHRSFSRTHYLLAMVKMQQGDIQSAVKHLRATITIVGNGPELPRYHAALGEVLFRTGDLSGAEEEFAKALEQDADYSQAHARLAECQRRAGSPDKALAGFAKAVRLDPGNEEYYRSLVSLLHSYPQAKYGPALEELLHTLDAQLPALQKPARSAALLYAMVWCLHPEPLYNHRVLRTIETVASGSENPHTLRLLARVQLLVGDARAAVLTLEHVRRHLDSSPPVLEELARCRETLLPDLVSFASVRSAVHTLEPGATLEDASARFSRFREVTSGDGAEARVLFLEAELLRRAGLTAEAAAQFAKVLELEQAEPEPYLGLWGSVRAHAGPQEAAQAVLRAFEGGRPPSRLLPVPPLAPASLSPVSPALGPRGETALEASPFEHPDPRLEHRSTRWQIREETASYASNPAFDLLSVQALERVSLPPGLLVPGKKYLWRAVHAGSDGRLSPFGEESPLVLPEARWSVELVDLTEHLNHDVVANPGDTEEDTFDAYGSHLVVDGYDGTRTGVPEVRGLPVDQTIGVHRLADYHGRNALTLTPSSSTRVRIEMAPQHSVALRFLVAGGDGDAELPVSIEFDDGSVVKARLYCDDWFHDVDSGPEDSLFPGSTAVWNGMDRLAKGLFEDANDAALFEVILPIDRTKRARALVLHAPEGQYESDATRFHLFSVVSMKHP